MFARDVGWGGGQQTGSWLLDKGFSEAVMELFGNWIKVVFAQNWDYIKCHWIAHFKVVNFEFRLNFKKKKWNSEMDSRIRIE